MRVHILPDFKGSEGYGIQRVVEAQRKYLPEFDVEVVDDKALADLTVGHGTIANLKPGAPFVSHSHGLHWSDYAWDDWAHETNRAVIDAMLQADAVTVPSQWVKRAFTRGMLRDFQVIYHGVDLEEWSHDQTDEGYVLWNKSRHDQVSNAQDVTLLAGRMSDTNFVTTLATANYPNLKIVGALPYSEMRQTVQRAGVYLATARETFGIGTLEALASGVPIAGWRHGGQVEIVVEGETGYLAEYGDYAGLAECVYKCLAQRKRLSANAREDARSRWQWRDKIEQYTELYQSVLQKYAVQPRVSVIVTCHNLAKYLNDALGSVTKQTFQDWECVIVDDASTDKTLEVAQGWVDLDKRFHYFKTSENLKLSRARNFGLVQSHGKYIIHLDADDILLPNTIATLASALDANPALHIVYGGLDLISDDGSGRRSNPFPGKFAWLGQMAHINQLPYCAMTRRSVLEATGGYRERQWRAEDAEMWCRVTSFGWRAEQATKEPTLLYRIRSDSKGAEERKRYADVDGDWCAQFPWRIASSGPEGSQKLRQQNFKIPNTNLIPFGAPMLPGQIWKIPHRESPAVSIIIPLGVGHERYVIDALDSLIGQTFGNWEAIIVNDTGTAIAEIPGAQWARIISTKGLQGAGVARNIGLSNARAPLVFFLDADDILRPDALMLMLQRYAKGDVGYIYSDWVTVQSDGSEKLGRANEYDAQGWLTKGQHAVSVLMATEAARSLNGFDEEMVGWEDWDFFIKAAICGICGVRVPEPLLTYREFTGMRRGVAFEQRETLQNLLKSRYKEYIEGSKQLMGCGGGCGGAKKAAARAITQQGVGAMQIQAEKSDRVRMEFLGRQMGPITYTVNGHGYAGANTDENRFVDALSADVAKLERLGIWRRVQVTVQVVQVSEPFSEVAPLPEVVPVPVPTPEPKDDGQQTVAKDIIQELASAVEQVAVKQAVVETAVKELEPKKVLALSPKPILPIAKPKRYKDPTRKSYKR